jgi:hypothetical protein
MLKNKNSRLKKTWEMIRRRTRKLLALLQSVWVAISGRWPVKPAGHSRPTRVVFLCHLPALWSKLEPVYLEARAAADLEPLVIAAHRDAEIRIETARFLASKGIQVEGSAEDPSTDLESLKPDYVFHSVPYEHFYPDHLMPIAVWRYARLCYVPYMGQLIFAGSVADITHDPSYFRMVRLAFVTDQDEKEGLLKNASWSTRRLGIKEVGSPQSEVFYAESEGPIRTRSGPLKVLWTPRWNTTEGNCHFFEYKDLLLEMSERGEFALTFRPHPLCLPHLLRTGELTKAEHDRYIERLEACPLARIDRGTDYLDAIRGHDVFVSDISSVLSDAALTGKPVIYTHRVNHFNELGRFLAEGFYWVRDAEELSSRLRALTRGDDYLQGRRREILGDFRRRQPAGAVKRILSEIRRDRNER